MAKEKARRVVEYSKLVVSNGRSPVLFSAGLAPPNDVALVGSGLQIVEEVLFWKSRWSIDDVMPSTGANRPLGLVDPRLRASTDPGALACERRCSSSDCVACVARLAAPGL